MRSTGASQVIGTELNLSHKKTRASVAPYECMNIMTNSGRVIDVCQSIFAATEDGFGGVRKKAQRCLAVVICGRVNQGIRDARHSEEPLL